MKATMDTQADLRRAPFGALLTELGERRDDVVVLAADLARYVDILDYADRHPDRFLQMGMSEQNTVGVASGLAKTGHLPVVVTYGVFLTRRAYDQVAMALATGPTRVLLVGFMPGITTPFRATHQAIDDVALMRALPHMQVIDPADAVDMAAGLEAAAEHEGPTYMRAFRGVQEPLERIEGDLDATLLAEGSEAAFVSTGLGSQWAAAARAELERSGVSVAHLHVPRLKPLAADALAEFCAGHDHVVCVENHTRAGGLFEAIAAALAERGVGVRLTHAGIPDSWPPSGGQDHIREVLGLDATALARLATAKEDR